LATLRKVLAWVGVAAITFPEDSLKGIVDAGKKRDGIYLITGSFEFLGGLYCQSFLDK
jgi:hypothetical protein